MEPFLNDMGAEEAWVPLIKTVAQLAEVLVLLFLLHVSIKKLGLQDLMDAKFAKDGIH